MNKLKGLKKVTKIINKFTQKNFGVTAMVGTEFLAYCDRKEINFAFAIPEDDINYYLYDVANRYPQIQADIFLWCLLHEVGHCMTDEIWSEEESVYFMNQKEEMLPYIEDDEMRNAWYHAIPDEYLATRWAANYMIKHPKKVAKFWHELQEELFKFYLKNNLA